MLTDDLASLARRSVLRFGEPGDTPWSTECIYRRLTSGRAARHLSSPAGTQHDLLRLALPAAQLLEFHSANHHVLDSNSMQVTAAMRSTMEDH